MDNAMADTRGLLRIVRCARDSAEYDVGEHVVVVQRSMIWAAG